MAKPKKKYSKKKKMNEKNIYFDNNLNIYYQNSLVGSFILHPQYKNFNQKIIENKKTKLEFIEKSTEEIITPKIFTKFTSGSMQNASDTIKILDFSDVYSMDRMSSISNPETGASLGYGLDYNYNIKNSNNQRYLQGNIAILSVAYSTLRFPCRVFCAGY